MQVPGVFPSKLEVAVDNKSSAWRIHARLPAMGWLVDRAGMAIFSPKEILTAAKPGPFPIKTPLSFSPNIKLLCLVRDHSPARQML